MDSLVSKVGSGEISRHVPTSPPPSKLKTYGFAIPIILGIGGLAVGAAGLTGYFHVGALSNMAQLDAIIMMAAGGGVGVVLLIIGSVKIRKSCSHQLQAGVHVDSERSGATRESGSIERAEIIKSIDTKGGLVYGPEAWKIWNVEVLDVVPPTPQVDLSKKDKVLLYIPQRIRVHGKEQDFTLKTLKEISGGPFKYFSISVEEQFGDNVAPGWVLIDKNVIPESRIKDYETQKRMVEERGCSMPSVLEAVVLNLMVFAFTGERLYGQEPWTYARCTEKVDGQYPVVVGGFGSAGLYVDYVSIFASDSFGVAGVQREF